MIAAAPALELHAIHKRFGAVSALTDVSMSVKPGSVHALLGENGAGKSTLVRVAFGLVQPDAGEIELDGLTQRFERPADAIAKGIGMVHQHFSLVPALTCVENVALGGRGRFDPGAAAVRLVNVAREAGLPVDPLARAGDLSVAARQRLEILKALVRGARILMLDEPTAVLTPDEASELLGWLRRYVTSGGSVVLITHRLREALAVADDVTVLRRGRGVSARAAGELSAAQLAAAMVGSAAERAGDAHAPPAASERTVVSVRDISIAIDGAQVGVRHVSFELRAGEIVGLAAVEGAGQRALLLALARRVVPIEGTIEGPPASEIAFIPEDRHRDALALDHTLTENLALRGLGARGGIMPWRTMRRRMTELLARADIRAPGPDTPVRHLSGGNQQRLILAREMESAVSLVVAENPTRGLDVNATATVHARLRAAAAGGAAVVLHSSDLDEVATLATRILVVHRGTVRDVGLDRDRIGRAMLGAE